MATPGEVAIMNQLATLQRQVLDARAETERVRQAHNLLAGQHAKLQEKVGPWLEYVNQYKDVLGQSLRMPSTFTPTQSPSWGPVLAPLMPVQPDANSDRLSARRTLPARGDAPMADRVVKITPDPLTQGWHDDHE